MKIRSFIVIVFICATYALPTFAQNVSKETSAEEAVKMEAGSEQDIQLEIILDLERPSETDLILLRNGDRLTGTVLNEGFGIRTSYGSMRFNNRVIAGIDLEGGANNIESILTVNNNRFSGFIDDPTVIFRLQAGTRIEIRREKIMKIVFRVREAETRGIPRSQFVVLKNGDYFSGEILNNRLNVATTYATVPISFDQVESVTMIGGDTPLTRVLMRNGDVLQGVLETEDINIKLDIGDEVGIYQDRINILYGRKGFIPDLHLIGSHGVVALTTASDDYEYELPGDAILVKSVPQSSPYYRHLQAGDRIIAVDNVPYADVPVREYKGQRGRLNPMRAELMDGQRSHINLTVERGGRTFTVRLIKG